MVHAAHPGRSIQRYVNPSRSSGLDRGEQVAGRLGLAVPSVERYCSIDLLLASSRSIFLSVRPSRSDATDFARSVGGLLFAAGAVVLFARKSGHHGWSDFAE